MSKVGWTVVVGLIGCGDATPPVSSPDSDTGTVDTSPEPTTAIDLLAPPEEITADCWSWQIEVNAATPTVPIQRVLRFHDPASLAVLHLEKDRNADGTMDYFGEFEWDPTGVVPISRSIDSDGDERYDSITLWEYDAYGNLTVLNVDDDGDGGRDSVWTYSYDGGVRVRAEEDAESDGDIDTVVTYAYDELGRPSLVLTDHGNEGVFDDTLTYTYVDDGPDCTTVADLGNDGLIDTVEVFGYDDLARLAHYEFDGDGEFDLIEDYTYTVDGGDLATLTRDRYTAGELQQHEEWTYTYAEPHRRAAEVVDYFLALDETVPALTLSSSYAWACP